MELITVADVGAWREWLDAHESTSDGIWLTLAKKGTTEPTSLTYAQALDEALCSGWIDGQGKKLDESTHLRRFTPRRARSIWSARNVSHVERLIEEGRMRSRGTAEMEKAKADGRWAAAYKGPATIEIPVELQEALDARPAAAAAFETLDAQNRYAILHRVTIGKKPETRQRNAVKYTEMLERGETPHPTKKS